MTTVATIQCKDIYSAIDSAVPATGTYQQIWSSFKSGSDNCNKGTDDYTALCSIIKPTNLSTAEVSALQSSCKTLLSDCKPTFCSDGATSAEIDISCDQLKDGLKLVLSDKTLISLLNSVLSKYSVPTITGISIDEICVALQVLNDIPKEIQEFVIAEIKQEIAKSPYSKYQEVITRYSQQIPTILNCLCPDLQPAPKLGPPPKFTCKQLTDGLNFVLADKALMQIVNTVLSKYGFTGITSIEDICSALQVLDESPQQITDNLLAEFKQAIGDTVYNQYQDIITVYSKEIPTILNCLCPGLGPPPTFNKGPIIYLCVTMGLVATIVSIILFVAMRKKKFPMVLGLSVGVFALCTLFACLLIILNPKCILRPCGKAGDSWKAVSKPTKYTGSYSLLGLAIGMECTLKPDNTVTFSKLSCSGGACPANNLLAECSPATVKVDTASHTDLGYPLVGSCMQKLQQYKTADGTSAVRGIWIVREGDDYSANIKIHACLSPSNCPINNGVINVPLKQA